MLAFIQFPNSCYWLVQWSSAIHTLCLCYKKYYLLNTVGVHFWPSLVILSSVDLNHRLNSSFKKPLVTTPLTHLHFENYNKVFTGVLTSPDNLMLTKQLVWFTTGLSGTHWLQVVLSILGTSKIWYNKTWKLVQASFNSWRQSSLTPARLQSLRASTEAYINSKQ